jgi:hypothetical protein
MLIPNLLLAALAITQPPVAPDKDRCARADDIIHYLDVSPTLARQGADIALIPMQARGPGSEREPADCISDWRVDPALAWLSADHHTLHIAADAKPGAELIISYKASGYEVRKPMRIVGRDEIVLTGVRRQLSIEGCSVQTPVGELEFREDKFAVTFMPFESYTDYWGRYRFDAASGALNMTIEGGNYRPADVDLDGKAHFDAAGKLVLEDVYFGQPAGSPSGGGACRYTFG